jgi:hypothetical protein
LICLVSKNHQIYQRLQLIKSTKAIDRFDILSLKEPFEIE